MDLSESALRAAFARTPLFEGKHWRPSPRPFALSREQGALLRRIGPACAAFYRAAETLYFENADIAALLDRGKPAALIAHARALRGQLPAVIRPDLLITQNGFALTELDSVPGGIGLTGFLGETYAAPETLGGTDGMATAFARLVRKLARGKENAAVAVAVSEEAAGYLPEFQWLAERMGKNAPIVCRAEALTADADGRIFAPLPDGTRRALDGIYRFFELFDWAQLPAGAAMARAAQSGRLALSPPMRPFQEEKLWLALFHRPDLEGFWRAQLGEATFALLKTVIPRGWAVLPETPPDGFASWLDVKRASQKKRALILKRSGFHPSAWGARSVTFGSDVSADVWAQKIDEALAAAPQSPFILQIYEKPVRAPHPVYEDGAARERSLRTRLCAYYFPQENGETVLGGVLATLCPADKKIIHGMSVATLLPCVEAAPSAPAA